ncbi:basal body-orientation factor 1-like [Lytechinus pictus]|uniref:basal body-orientation factor 1-like n=1 Tax=Lytechinus variegatus TaxID=7654 RepID=UPI001BB16351|nr:basal body-orientation factor 1-like [Lytechinus variegatus]XP_054759062.1 basal body-orientation factor 1-like [Lytechinus pictus]
MPKKTKKGGKGKGKGKGKKGKKAAKDAKKFSDGALEKANTKLWESRLVATENARQEFREEAKRLALQNESLQKNMQISERDTIEVITYLKKEDQTKEDLISKLQKQLKDTRRESRKEKQQIIEDFTERFHQLEQALTDKTEEVKMMQSELKLVKEFRRKRGQMQKELDEIKEEMFLTNKEHQQQLQRMEHKFFEEKIRLQQEASQKIAELAERAHTEAISNLDETTRSVYKENVRLTEALNYHVKEADELRAEKEKLLKENSQIKGDRELQDQLIQEKVISSKKQKKQINELQEKVQSLETSLSHVVKEFEREQKSSQQLAGIEAESSKVEIAKLMRTVDMQTKEMNKVKKLAKTILDQRTEMEQFFLDSLEMVKKEIVANQAKYLRDAAAAYQKRMIEAHSGKKDYPRIRTFNQTDNSTNSVFSDLKAAETWSGLGTKLDISELTWEQRERILRLLFAKMNGAKTGQKPVLDLKPSPSQKRPQVSVPNKNMTALAIEAPPESDDKDQTFLTQAEVDPSTQLPAVHQSTSIVAM